MRAAAARASRPASGEAPFCGAKTRAAPSGPHIGLRTSHATESSHPAQAPAQLAQVGGAGREARAERLQRAPAAVGGGAAADGHDDLARAGVERRARSARRCRGSRPPPGRARRRAAATGPTPAPARRPRRGRRRASANAAVTSRPSGSVAPAPQDPAAASAARSPPSSPRRRRRPAAASTSSTPARQQAAADRRRGLGGGERALELVGRDEDRPGHGRSRCERLSNAVARLAAEDGEDDRAPARCPRRGGAAPPRPRSAPPRRAGSRRPRCRTRPAQANGRRARRRSRACWRSRGG